MKFDSEKLKKNKLTIIAIAVLLIVAVIAIMVALKGTRYKPNWRAEIVTDENGVPVTDENGNVVTTMVDDNIIYLTDANGQPMTNAKGEQLTLRRDKSEVVVVTDKNGVPVTNENGDAITAVLETEIVELTNANGDKLRDENGEVRTSIKYHPKDVEVPKTDSDGNYVTNSNGKIESTKITVPSPVEKVIVTEYVTDAFGNTLVDENGNKITIRKEVTTKTAGQGGNNSVWGATAGGSGNDQFNAVAPTPDGGYIALLQSNSADGSVSGVSKNPAFPYMILIKYDSNGKMKWQKAISANDSTVLNSIDVDSNGNIYAAGYSKATDLGSPSYGNYDAVMFKFNSSGDMQWNQSFGGSMTDGFYGVSVTPDGGIAAVGMSGSSDGSAATMGISNGSQAAVLVKFTSNGSVSYAKAVGATGDSFTDVDVDSNGNIYAVGNFAGNAAGDIISSYGKADAVACKFDSNGNLQWIKQYGGSQVENFSGIVATGDGCVMVGRSRSNDGTLASLGNQGEYDAIIVKYSANGELVFHNTFRGPYTDNFTSIKQTTGGKLVVSGSSYSGTRDLKTVGNKGGSDGIIVTYDANGQLASVQGYGGTRDDKFDCVCILSNGEIVACGNTLSSNGDLAGGTATSNGKTTVGMIARFK